jgi:histidinol-phosphate phosphatase family protein
MWGVLFLPDALVHDLLTAQTLRRQVGEMQSAGAAIVTLVGERPPPPGIPSAAWTRSWPAGLVSGHRVLVASGLWHWELAPSTWTGLTAAGTRLLVKPSSDPWAEREHLVCDSAGQLAGFQPPGKPGSFTNRVSAGLAVTDADNLPRRLESLADLPRALSATGEEVTCVPLAPIDYAIDAGTLTGAMASATRSEQLLIAARARGRPAPVSHVFLDRDGVLNLEDGHLTQADDLVVLPGVPDAVARLNRHGITCSVVTNQSALARGLLDETELARIHQRLNETVRAAGGTLARFDICPFHPDTSLPGGVRLLLRDSDLRKPKPALIFQAARHLGLDLAGSCLVGDTLHDFAAATLAGIRFVAVRSAKNDPFPPEVPTFPDLAGAAGFIIENWAAHSG